MKVEFANGIVPISEIPYSKCFMFPRGTVVDGADPTKLYIRVQTKQWYRKLKKADSNYTRTNCARGMSLEDTVVLLMPLDTQVITVDAKVVVDE